MIKAEIMTDGGTYYVNITKATEPLKALADVRRTITDGNAFEGADGDLLFISGPVKHIRIFEEVVAPVTEPLEIRQGAKPTTPGPHYITFKYLGTELKVKLAVLSCGGIDYFLPVAVNDIAVDDAIDPVKLTRLLIAAYAERGFQPIKDFIIVMPHAPITQLGDALEYLQDYVKELGPNSPAGQVKKNASAYHGLKGAE